MNTQPPKHLTVNQDVLSASQHLARPNLITPKSGLSIANTMHQSTSHLPSKTAAYGTTGSTGEIFSVRTHLQDLEVTLPTIFHP